MANPFIGEIRMFGGNYAPVGWNFCDGSLLQIARYEALFNLLGTTYGGDGQSTFAVPDLRGRIPLHRGNLSGGANYLLGQAAGTETVALTVQQLPSHSHGFPASSSSGSSGNPNGNVVAAGGSTDFTDEPVDTAMGNQMIVPAGNSQPHANMMPYQCVSFIIATEGIFPTQN